MTILLNTKLRRKLLTYSFTHPDEQYYVRELASLIDEDPGNLSRELRKIEEDGLFISSRKGSVKFYSLNRYHPLFKELKTIIFKTEGVEGSLRSLVSGHKGISLAFVHGSYAKNKEKSSSDIDLVTVGTFPVNKFTSEIRKLESKLNREINFTHYDIKEFAKKRKKKGDFLDLVLKDKKIILKGKLNA